MALLRFEGRSCHNAAPMVLFCFGGMVSKSFDGDKYAVSETSLNLQMLISRLSNRYRAYQSGGNCKKGRSSLNYQPRPTSMHLAQSDKARPYTGISAGLLTLARSV